MSPGKLAAQAAHAETLAVQDLWNAHSRESELCPEERAWLRMQQDLWNIWFGHGHYAKYVMKADDSTMMTTIKHYLEARGFRTYLVIDEGHTEETWMVPTAMAVELVDKDEERTASVFSNFRMYREKRPLEPLDSRASRFDLAVAGPFRRALRATTRPRG